MVSSVSLGALIFPFAGEVYRHLPFDSPFEVTDFRLAGQGAGNRWNSPGQRTLYLAIDPAVALAEWARHLQASFDPRTDPPLRRRMYRLRIELAAVLDLRDPRVWEALGGVVAQSSDFLEVTTCRALADFVRRATTALAIFVPSIAFLDRLDRGNLVVFLEKVEDEKELVRDISDLGVIGYNP